jgi:hypothetical protein
MKTLLLVLMVIMMGVGIGVQNTYVYAGGPEHDYDERYEDIPGAPECWTDGYVDGQDGPYDHNRSEECRDKGDQYHRAFIHGCESVQGNTRDVCESATDS